MENQIGSATDVGTRNNPSQFEQLQSLKSRILSISLYGIAIVGLILYFILLPGILNPINLIQLIGSSAAVVMLLLLAFISKLPDYSKIASVALVLFGISAYSLFTKGLQGYGLVFLVAFVLWLLAFGELYIGIASALLGLFLLATITVLSTTDIYQPEVYKAVASRPTPLQWTTAMVLFLAMSAVFSFVIFYFQIRYVRNLGFFQSIESDLHDATLAIEKLTFEQERSIQKRNQQIEVAGLIGRQISSLQDPQSLLEQTVNLIRENFSFYHVGVFVLDAQKEYAVLKAATGEAGKTMLERQHRLRVGEVGIVGNVSKQGDAHIALDVGADAVHFRNPILPDTRSEMGLPLKVGDEIIGVLDVQSTQEAAFTQDDVKILQIVADQLATAINRSEVYNQLQRTIQELQTSARSYTQETWDSFLKKSNRLLSFKITDGQETTDASLPASALEVIHAEEPIVNVLTGPDGKKRSNIQLPFKLREQPLGILDLLFDSENVSSDILDFLKTTADRLALALENARLLEEIQDRANQEHIVRGISEKVTSSPDINDILKMAAEEIGKSLGISSVRVSLAPSEKNGKQ